MTTDDRDESYPRYRGILTSGDRSYLEDEYDPQDQSSGDRNQRYRIRKRIAAAMADMTFLNRHLPLRDQKKVFEDIFEDDPQAISEALIFLYTGLRAVDSSHYSEETLREELQELLSSVIERGELQQGNLSDPTISIQINSEDPDFDEIRDQLLAGEGTWRDIHYLSHHGEDIELLEAIADGDEEIKIAYQGTSRSYFIGPKEANSLLQTRLSDLPEADE